MTEGRQSLTLVVAVTDEAACSAALLRGRSALEAAFAQVAGLQHASLAVLAATRDTPRGALFFECAFEGSLSTLLGALFAVAEPEFNAVFAACVGFAEAADARAFAAYVSARARRASAAAEGAPSSPWRVWCTELAARCYWPPNPAVPEAAELERRRGAVGMQDWEPCTPLLHVARVPAAARARVKRALRALEREPTRLDASARFVWHGEQLLFFAFPRQIALLWSEQVSREALAPLTRVWATVPEFQGRPWLRRARRTRQVQRFLLDGRTPVGAWFNASAPCSA